MVAAVRKKDEELTINHGCIFSVLLTDRGLKTKPVCLSPACDTADGKSPLLHKYAEIVMCMHIYMLPTSRESCVFVQKHFLPEIRGF